MKNLISKLKVDPDKDLKRLIEAIINDKVTILPTGMEKHFEIAKAKPESFLNHDFVLGISIGGSNTKLILAQMDKGKMVVHHLVSQINPPAKIHYSEYFDNILFGDEVIRNYLVGCKKPCIGISIAVPVIDGVPYHKNKIPTIDGLIARDFKKDAPSHNIKQNIDAYLKERGVYNTTLFCQFDAIVANYGGASMCNLTAEEKTLLLVCGTGMATAIENETVSIGMVDVFDHTLDDDGLLPYNLTEGHQYQYSIAGKGLYGLMERAIRQRAKEEESKLYSFNPSDYFASPHDSKTVIEIWESTLGDPISGKCRQIMESVGPDVFSELQKIATAIVERAITGLANCVIATIYADAENLSKKRTVFFEGSIALNSNILPRIKKEIARRLQSSWVFDDLKISKPPLPLLDKELMPAVSSNQNRSKYELQQVDLTLKGTVTSAIAEEILQSQRS